MNPLVGLFSPLVRKWLYIIYSLAGVIVGALAVLDVDVQKAPDLLAYLGTALGLVAASNVPTPDTDEPRGGQDGHSDTATLLIVCAVVLLVLLAFGVLPR